MDITFNHPSYYDSLMYGEYPELVADLGNGEQLAIWAENYEVTDITYLTKDSKLYTTKESRHFPHIWKVFPKEQWLPSVHPSGGYGSSPHPALIELEERLREEQAEDLDF